MSKARTSGDVENEIKKLQREHELLKLHEEGSSKTLLERLLDGDRIPAHVSRSGYGGTINGYIAVYDKGPYLRIYISNNDTGELLGAFVDVEKAL
jgi:hypothetical protein